MTPETTKASTLAEQTSVLLAHLHMFGLAQGVLCAIRDVPIPFVAMRSIHSNSCSQHTAMTFAIECNV